MAVSILGKGVGWLGSSTAFLKLNYFSKIFFSAGLLNHCSPNKTALLLEGQQAAIFQKLASICFVHLASVPHNSKGWLLSQKQEQLHS